MIKMMSSMVVGPKLLDMFNIDSSGVTGFTIECKANKPVLITVEYEGDFVEADSDFETIIKEFKLVRVLDDKPPPEPMPPPSRVWHF